MFSRYEKPTYDELREILSHLNYADRDQWFKTFTIVGREYPNDSTAFEICKQWSSQYSGRKPEDERKEREEFFNQSKRSGAGIGSLINQAKATGYKPKRPHTEQIDPHGTQAPADLFAIMANSMNVVPEKNDPLLDMYGEAQTAAQYALKFWMWDESVKPIARAAFLRRYSLAFDLLPRKERNYFELLDAYSQSHSTYSFDALVVWAEDNYSDFDKDAAIAFLAGAFEASNIEAATEHMDKAIKLSWQLHTQKCSQALTDYLRQTRTSKETEIALEKFLLATRPFNPQLSSLNADDVAPVGRRVISELLNPALSALHYQKTGYAEIDRFIYGWRRGEVSIMAAHSGVGKTWFGVDASRNVIANGGNVLFVTTEMSKDAIAERFFCNVGSISMQKLQGDFNADQLLNHATKDNEEFFKDPDSLSVIYASDLTTIINAIDARNDVKQIDLVVVDYLQNIHNDKADHRNTANWERVNSTMNELTKCANRNHLPILVLAQLNNPNRKAGNNQEPNLYDIADASGVVRDAAAVMVMYRVNVGQGEYINELRCKIVKSRYGNQPESYFIATRSTGSRFKFVWG